MEIQYVVTSVLFGLCALFRLLKLLTEFQYVNFSLVLYIRQLKERKFTIFSFFPVITWLLLIGYILVIFDDAKTAPYHIAVTALFGLESIFLYRSFSTMRFSTFLRLKSFCLFIFVIIFMTLFYFFPLLDPYVWLVILDRAVFLILCIGILAFAFPSEIYADFLVQRAMQKVGKRKDIFTIIILGKDKKRVMQEITTVLSERYIVAHSGQTLFTIQQTAEVLLKKIKGSTEVFVAAIDLLDRKDIRLLRSFFSIHSIVITTIDDKSTFATAQHFLHEVDKNCLIISDIKNHLQVKKYSKLREIYYADSRDDAISKKHPLLYTKEKVKTKAFYSFDIYCNEKHLMKLRIPQALVVEKKLFLPGIYLALGLDMTINMVKKAFQKRDLL